MGKLLSFGLSETLSADLLATALQRFGPEAIKKLPYLMAGYDAYITSTSKGAKGQFSPPSQAPAPSVPPPPPSSWSSLRDVALPFASNNWAVSGAHTKNQKPLIAGDPHQPLTSFAALARPHE